MSDVSHSHFFDLTRARRGTANILVASIVSVGLAALLGCGEVVTQRTLEDTQIRRIETELVRGSSTKTDVLQLLGEPDGSGELGGFRSFRGLNAIREGAIDLWFYERAGSRQSLVSKELDLSFLMLLVFFEGNTYDGFYWFNGEGAGELVAR